jgi:catechol 2,3-dioxygenase-like lactoylglutathione lyase family enzyme
MTAEAPENGAQQHVSVGFQVTVDCTDAYQQARFWSQVLGYEIEHKDELIRGLQAKGFVKDDDVIEIDGGLYFRIGVGIRRPGFDDTRVREPGGRLLFLNDPRPKTEKNRLHLDVHVGAERLTAEVERVVALGAKVLYECNEMGGHWFTLTDPEGNEFCIQ